MIGNEAFAWSSALVDVEIPLGIAQIGRGAFSFCTALNCIKIPPNVTSIGDTAFKNCTALTNVLIAGNLSSIGDQAFSECPSLNAIHFSGDAPTTIPGAFSGDSATVYYLPGTSGWTNYLEILPTAPWSLPYPVIPSGNSGTRIQNNQFGFTISWATNLPVAIDVCSNLAEPAWQPIQTNALVNGSSYFSDMQWTNFASRFYRLRAP